MLLLLLGLIFFGLAPFFSPFSTPCLFHQIIKSAHHDGFPRWTRARHHSPGHRTGDRTEKRKKNGPPLISFKGGGHGDGDYKSFSANVYTSFSRGLVSVTSSWFSVTQTQGDSKKRKISRTLRFSNFPFSFPLLLSLSLSDQVAKRKGELEEAGWSFEMKISFIEIYCEQFNDLLASDNGGSSGGGGASSSSSSTKAMHNIKQNEFGQNIVTNVKMVSVDPADKEGNARLLQQAASLRRWFYEQL
jgi:hypothetical protein